MPVFDDYKHGDMGRWVKQQMEEKLKPDVLEGTGFECGRPWMEVAESAYKAYAAATGNLSSQGSQMPAWANLSLKTQWAWEAAVRQVASILVVDAQMDESYWNRWKPKYPVFVVAGDRHQFNHWMKQNDLPEDSAVYVSAPMKLAGCRHGSTIYLIGNWYKRADREVIKEVIQANHLTAIDQTEGW